MIGSGTDVPATTLCQSSPDTLSTPPHCHVDSDLLRFPSFSVGGTMVSADSIQTDYSAAFVRFSRISQDKTCSFHTVQAKFAMLTLWRKHPLLPRLVRFDLFSVFVHPVCVSPPAYFPPHICCDAVAFSYLIPPCQRRIEDSHPNYVSCLTYNKKPRGNRGVEKYS